MSLIRNMWPLSLFLTLVWSCADSREITIKPGWQEVRSDVLNFRVTMPGKPVERMEDVQSDTGAISIRYFSYKKGDEFVLALAVTDFPEAPVDQASIKSMLDAARDNALAKNSIKLVSETDMRIEGRPGRKLICEFPNAGLTGEMQLIAVRGRLYALGAFQRNGRYASECREFLESFQLIDPKKE